MLLYNEILEEISKNPGVTLDQLSEKFGHSSKDLGFTYTYCKRNLKPGFEIKTDRLFKLSAKWALKPFDCTLNHIKSTCGGKCCSTAAFWPPNAFPNHVCGYLGTTGCTLEFKDRPVSCMLFPLVLTENNSLGLFNRSMFKTSVCKDAFGKGPTIIEGQAFAFEEIFGKGQYRQALASVSKGNDFYFRVSEKVLHSFDLEIELDNKGVPPIPRSQQKIL